MSKNNENKLVPKLRFLEFKNEKSWNVDKLENLAENIMYGMNAAAVDFDGENKYIRITDIDEDTRAFSPNPLTSPEGLLEEKYSLKIGDLLFARTGASVGKSYLHVKENGKIYFAGFLIRFTIKNAVPYFIYAQTLTKHYQKWVIANSVRSGQPGINAEEYKSYPVFLPPDKENKEQQKIAACLSSLDEIITAESQKLEVLKDHKRGLLQNLLPVGKESVPKIRFKEFQNDEDWNEDTLANIARFRRGSFPQPYGLPEWYDDDNGMPFIQVFDVGEDFRLKPSTKRKISSLAAEQSVFIPQGTLIITIQGSIGRVAITQYDAYIDRTLLLFEEFYQDVDITFFAYTIFLLFEIEKQKAPGGIIKTITKEVLSSFVVKMPSIKEQQKIASCLTSLDELISAQIEKIESLQIHKKGLLQGLFPNLNEVTE